MKYLPPVALLVTASTTFSFTININNRNSRYSKTLLSSAADNAENISRRNVFAKSASAIAGGLGIITSSPFYVRAEVSEETPVVTTSAEVSEETPVATTSAEVSEETPVVTTRAEVPEETPVVTTPAVAAYRSSVSEETPVITTRMGGLLEKYQGSSGWRILAPSGWNKFEGEVGAYDVKWQDVVSESENVKVSTSPVKSTTTSIDALGEVKKVGESLALKRSAKLISAEERLTEGILYYTFDFALQDKTHQLLLLCVSKGKVWSLDANSTQKRWSKREELYKNILGSFVPKLT